jgi:hypothetical protein
VSLSTIKIFHVDGTRKAKSFILSLIAGPELSSKYEIGERVKSSIWAEKIQLCLIAIG